MEEWHGLLKAARSPREAALLWLLGGGAGLCVSEVAALKVEHVDGTGGYLYIVNEKGCKQRTSILTKPVLEVLQTHLNGQDVGLCLPGQRSLSYIDQADPEAARHDC